MNHAATARPPPRSPADYFNSSIDTDIGMGEQNSLLIHHKLVDQRTVDDKLGKLKN